MSDTVTMRCSAEEGWPQRTFHREGVNDHCCAHCGWYQVSFAHGCRELCLSVIWHDVDLFAQHARVALTAGLPIEGAVRFDVKPRAGANA